MCIVPIDFLCLLLVASTGITGCPRTFTAVITMQGQESVVFVLGFVMSQGFTQLLSSETSLLAEGSKSTCDSRTIIGDLVVKEISVFNSRSITESLDVSSLLFTRYSCTGQNFILITLLRSLVRQRLLA